ncbi:MAG TPA: single-stranded DNA-binding protein [Ilumatobacter sp.]|nr:single-stranded DNA-binding protein [Ilumatobacter sp.]
MATDNFVQIIGNVTRDPELRYTTGGAAVCSFGIAYTPRRRNANGDWEDGETSFFNCSAWRDLGENIAASITKGNRVVVTGSVRARDWEDRDGNKRTSIEIDVDDCAPSLRWAQAQIERTSRSGGPSGGGSNQGGGGGSSQGGGARQPDPVYGDEEPF